MEKILDNDKYEIFRLEIDLLNTGHITNCYIIKTHKNNETMVIDPSFNAEYIIDNLNKIDANLKTIYLTHCHGDHIAALEGVYDKYKGNGAKIIIHENDKDGIFDDQKNCKYILTEPNFKELDIGDIHTVKNEEKIILGDVEFEVIHTPRSY